MDLNEFFSGNFTLTNYRRGLPMKKDMTQRIKEQREALESQSDIIRSQSDQIFDMLDKEDENGND